MEKFALYAFFTPSRPRGYDQFQEFEYGIPFPVR